MGISPKQAYVLDNVERVRSLSPKVEVISPRPRYQLDGWECTQQIRSLLAKAHLVRYDGGCLQRSEGRLAKANRPSGPGERRPAEVRAYLRDDRQTA